MARTVWSSWRADSKEQLVDCGEDDAPEDLLEIPSETAPWLPTVEENQVALIEQIARDVVDQIDDTFIRAVACASWFANERPLVSGARETAEGEPPLTTRFKNKSRHQITRALRHADAQLVAALLAAEDLVLTPGIKALLERLGGRRRRSMCRCGSSSHGTASKSTTHGSVVQRDRTGLASRSDRTLSIGSPRSIPSFAGNWYEFFEDLVLSDLGDVASETREAEESIARWIQSSGVISPSLLQRVNGLARRPDK